MVWKEKLTFWGMKVVLSSLVERPSTGLPPGRDEAKLKPMLKIYDVADGGVQGQGGAAVLAVSEFERCVCCIAWNRSGDAIALCDLVKRT